MLVNHAQAGTEVVAIADASSATHALTSGSAVVESIQDHLDPIDAQGGKDGERKTCGMMNSISERSPLSETDHHGAGHISPCAHLRPPSYRREARHFFRPRSGQIGSACKLEDDSACLPGGVEGPSDHACAPADSMRSLSLVSAAFSAEIGAMASVASATAAPACRAAAGDACAEADTTPMPVPAADSTQLPAPALVQQNTRNIHDVARLVSQLFGSQPGNEFSFGAAKRLKLQSCWPASWRRNLTGLPACPQQLSKAEASKIMYAAVLSQGGATISNVTLDLGKAGILVLQGTSRTELKNVVVEGGILLCHGPQCHLTLTDCTLKGCKLIIAERATADIQRTHIQEHFSINDAAFVTSGRGTTVHAIDTHVCVGRGFVVQDRAQLTGTGMHLTGVNGSLITAVGTGTEVTLERSNFEFLHDKGNPIVAASLRVLFRGCAATSSDGAVMTLNNCELKAFHRAVHAARHARIHFEGCVAETFREDGEGVYAQMAHVSLKDSQFVGCGEYGVCVSGGGPTTKAHVVAERCTVEGSRRTVSVQKDDWSSAEIRECVLDGQSVTATW